VARFSASPASPVAARFAAVSAVATTAAAFAAISHHVSLFFDITFVIAPHFFIQQPIHHMLQCEVLGRFRIQ
jgi:hypothetical protein